MAVVDAAGLCFAGAMASFGVTPRCYQGDPARWADELDRILDLAPVIVPGHGPIGGEADVRVLQQYLRHCAAGTIPPGPWDEWIERDPRDAINVERARLLAQGRDEMPPAMLKAIGFG